MQHAANPLEIFISFYSIYKIQGNCHNTFIICTYYIILSATI